MDQTHSVFMPGLTRRGPVYNSLGAMPVLSPNIKLAIELGLIAAGVMKKLPLPIALGAAFLLWKMSNPPAPITAGINPADLAYVPPPPPDMPMPTFPAFPVG